MYVQGAICYLSKPLKEVEMEPKDPMLMSPAEYREWQEQEEEDFARRDQMEAGLLIEGDAEEDYEEDYEGAYGWWIATDETGRAIQ
jgi:hypothetical protein